MALAGAPDADCLPGPEAALPTRWLPCSQVVLALFVANIVVLRKSDVWMRLRRDGVQLPSTEAIKLKVLAVRKARTAPEQFEDEAEELSDAESQCSSGSGQTLTLTACRRHEEEDEMTSVGIAPSATKPSGGARQKQGSADLPSVTIEEDADAEDDSLQTPARAEDGATAGSQTAKRASPRGKSLLERVNERQETIKREELEAKQVELSMDD